MGNGTLCWVSCGRCGVAYEATLSLRPDGRTRCEFCGAAAQAGEVETQPPSRRRVVSSGLRSRPTHWGGFQLHTPDGDAG
jgi:hypothetical protein